LRLIVAILVSIQYPNIGYCEYYGIVAFIVNKALKRMPSNIWDSRNQILQNMLKNLRKHANLTQLELAELLDKPQSYVSKYESGERRLDLIELREIVTCCQSSLNKFVSEFEILVSDEV